MLDWIRTFLVIPLSYIAALATAAWLTVEILALTTFGLVMKLRKASRAYYSLIRKPQQKSLAENPMVWIALISITLTTAYLVVRKRK